MEEHVSPPGVHRPPSRKPEPFLQQRVSLATEGTGLPHRLGAGHGSVQNPKCLRHVKNHGVCCQEAEGRTSRTHVEDNLSLWTLLQTNNVSR